MHQERFCKTQHVSWIFSFVYPFSSSSSSSSILGVFNKNADLIKKIMFASTSMRIGPTNVQPWMFAHRFEQITITYVSTSTVRTDAVGVMAATHCHS